MRRISVLLLFMLFVPIATHSAVCPRLLVNGELNYEFAKRSAKTLVRDKQAFRAKVEQLYAQAKPESEEAKNLAAALEALQENRLRLVSLQGVDDAEDFLTVVSRSTLYYQTPRMDVISRATRAVILSGLWTALYFGLVEDFMGDTTGLLAYLGGLTGILLVNRPYIPTELREEDEVLKEVHDILQGNRRLQRGENVYYIRRIDESNTAGFLVPRVRNQIVVDVFQF